MLIKDLSSIFGVSTVVLRSYTKRYKLGVLIAILLDLLILSLPVIKILVTSPIMMASEFTVNFLVCIFASAISTLAISVAIKTDYKEAYSFYNRNKSCKVEVKRYTVTEEKLFSILFCSGYQRTRPDCTLDTYKESFRNACCQNRKYAKRIMKYLSRYEDSENGSLVVYVMNGNRASYFVDFKED